VCTAGASVHRFYRAHLERIHHSPLSIVTLVTLLVALYRNLFAAVSMRSPRIFWLAALPLSLGFHAQSPLSPGYVGGLRADEKLGSM
jgi:hypothetical protein